MNLTWLGSADVPKFIGKALLKWTENKWDFSPVHPKDTPKGPGITWRIVRRVPGKGSLDTQKPSRRTSYVDNDQIVEVYSQYQTVIYEFNFYNLVSDELDQMVTDWEEFIYYLQPALQKVKVEDFLFQEELAQEIANPGGRSEELYGRTLRYVAYIQKRWDIYRQKILAIEMSASTDVNKLEKELVRGDATFDVLTEGPDVGVISVKTDDKIYFPGDWMCEKVTPPGQALPQWVIIWTGPRKPLPDTSYQVNYYQIVPTHQSSIN